MIVAEPGVARIKPVCGAAMTPSEARITIVGVPDVPGTSLEIFSRLADRKITVDMIVQNVGEEGKSDISFTVPSSELDAALQAVEEAAKVVGASRDHARRRCGQSLGRRTGHGQADGCGQQDVRRAGRRRDQHPDDHHQRDQDLGAGRTRRSADRRCGPCTKSSSWNKEPDQVHADCGGPLSPAHAANGADGYQRSASSVCRSTDMEELVLNDITLDESSGSGHDRRRPESAGRGGQGVSERGRRRHLRRHDRAEPQRISGTDQSQLHRSPRHNCSSRLGGRRTAGQQTSAASGHPSPSRSPNSPCPESACAATPASRFACSARWPRPSINVDMISTSEVRVNVVVDGRHGRQGLTKLQQAFTDVLR